MLTERQVQRMRSLDSLEALLDFARAELGWPIDDYPVEDITYTYEPEDVGLKPELAPKVRRIYQLRPPSDDTPWGIFLIDFDNKKLPATLLRRILNHLAVKRRAAHYSSGRKWDPGDLLFLTTYGEEAEGMREVAFAHFHQQEGDLPTLRVVQWDALDTDAKLQSTYEALRAGLGWPEDPSDADAWRQQWRQPFKHRVGHVIRTAKDLADRLATLSRDIRDSAIEVLDAETERGPMTRLYKAFQCALIHDLKPHDFADTFAQTVAYGLLTAAISRTDPGGGTRGTVLLAEDIAHLVPITNPFLKEILETFLDVGGRRKGGIDFDELGIQDVVELLRGEETDLPAVIADFGNRRQGEDPVIHFYEDYLKAYDSKLKVKRGVFYTPRPVVSYIVRSVDELLQSEFGLEDGLASTVTWAEMHARNAEITIPEGTDPDSPFVVVLDPATGTGTFLVEVIEVVWRRLERTWQTDPGRCLALLRSSRADSLAPRTFSQFWNAYVPDHLLPRLYGYELMMAPYAIAHMKVGLKLGETGYRFGSTQRVRIYLTNALEPAGEMQARLALDWEALAHEALAVKGVKETQRFTVVIGNPPYSVSTQNRGSWASALVDGYKQGLNEKKHTLDDDYVKFIALAQVCCTTSGVGLVGFITNHGYVKNPTFRAMRRSLLQSVSLLSIYDLHGNVRQREKTLGSEIDDNVFDIQQGVAITIAVLAGARCEAHRARFAELWGPRDAKYQVLGRSSASATEWRLLSPWRSRLKVCK